MPADSFSNYNNEENIEDVPRRLRRYYRDKYPQKGFLDGFLSFMKSKKEERVVRDVVSQIGDKTKESDARHQVHNFKERHNRLPDKDEYEILIDNIYSQSKREISKEDEIKKTFDSLRSSLGKGKFKTPSQDKKHSRHSKKREDKKEEKKSRRNRNKKKEETKDAFSQAFSSDPFSSSPVSLKDLVSKPPSVSKKSKPKKSSSELEELSFDESEFSLPDSLSDTKKKKPKK